jgi:hypothetical protein
LCSIYFFAKPTLLKIRWSIPLFSNHSTLLLKYIDICCFLHIFFLCFCLFVI